MKDVQFNEPTYTTPSSRRSQQHGGLVGWLIKRKIAKNKKQAMYILVGVIVVAMGIALFVFPTSDGAPVPINTDEDIYYDGPNA